MRLIPVLVQIFVLAAGFSSNRRDAMYGAAAFAVLTVVIYALTRIRKQRSERGASLKPSRGRP